FFRSPLFFFWSGVTVFSCSAVFAAATVCGWLGPLTKTLGTSRTSGSGALSLEESTFSCLAGSGETVGFTLVWASGGLKKRGPFFSAIFGFCVTCFTFSFLGRLGFFAC